MHKTINVDDNEHVHNNFIEHMFAFSGNLSYNIRKRREP